MHEPNPYAPPSIASEPPQFSPGTGPMKVASQGTRFINYILDSIITAVAGNAAAFMVGLAWGLTRPDPTAPIMPEDETFLNVIGFFVSLTAIVAYFVLTEALLQRSLAKFVTGTRVVRVDGGRPSLGQIVGRSFARLIPFEPFSFLGGNNPVGWHDSLSGTRVIKVG